MQKSVLVVALLLPAVAFGQAPTRNPLRGILGGRGSQQQEAPPPTPVGARDGISQPVVAGQDNEEPAREKPKKTEDKEARPAKPKAAKPAAKEEKKPDSAHKPAASGAAGAETASAKRPSPTELEQSADEVTSAVGEFLKAANDGLYTKAKGYLTPQLQKYFDSEISIPHGSMKTVFDNITRDGDIVRVRYLDVPVRGEGARVDAEISYGAGGTERRTFDLLKTDGKWRILLQTGAPGSAGASPRPIQEVPRPAGAPGAGPAGSPAAGDGRSEMAEGASPQPEPSTTGPAGGGTVPASPGPAAPSPADIKGSASPGGLPKSAATTAAATVLADAPWRTRARSGDMIRPK